MKKYKLAACGGTFDLFHKGHEKFLHTVFTNSQKVIIGLTSDDFVLQKKTFEKFSDRKKTLQNFLDIFNYDGEIISIDDIYGPTTSDRYRFDTIFVTEDSKKGANDINQKRKEKGLEPLLIEKIELQKDLMGGIISSNRIRNGEIDREGNFYIDKSLLLSDFILPKELRENLSKPFGKVIKDFDTYLKSENLEKDRTISIGDVTTQKFIENKIIPKISIIDLVVNRVKKYNDISEFGYKFDKNIQVINPAGSITKELFGVIIDSFKNKQTLILVAGEEDLAVIPAVLASPLGYEIYYGQPGEGAVKIEVTEEKKMEIKKLISKFTRKVI